MSLGFNCKITLCILSAGKALYKRAKIWELNCLEVETDVWESLQSQFSFFQCDGEEEQGSPWRLLGLPAEPKEGGIFAAQGTVEAAALGSWE